MALSSGIEQVFSSYELVYSKLRNCLSKDSAAKLMFLFKTINANTAHVEEFEKWLWINKQDICYLNGSNFIP